MIPVIIAYNWIEDLPQILNQVTEIWQIAEGFAAIEDDVDRGEDR